MSFLRVAEFKVGMLVVVVGSLIAFMSMEVSNDPSYLGRSKRAWFLVKNADGLVKGAAVKTAGIPVGSIKDIKLQEGKARVEISVKSDMPLHTSAAVQIKSMGILGDKSVDVFAGASTDPVLADNGQIMNVIDKGSIDNVLNEVGEVTSSLKVVAQNLKEATSKDGTREHILGRIISNIEKLTGDISEMTDANKDKIADIVDQVHGITSTLDELVNDDGENGLRKTWKKSLAHLDNSLKNIDEITSKVNRGEGTLGKLISDESTAEDVSNAISGVSNLVDTASRVQTGFDIKTEYLSSQSASKGYIGVKVQPGLDRYYYIALVDDPLGAIDNTDTKVTDNGSGTVLSNTNNKTTYHNKTKLTLLYAKNFWDWTLRGGLMENSAGFGVDYNFFRKKAKLSLEAFNMSTINVRASASYSLGYGFYLTGGMSDMLDKQNQRSAYLGAGLSLTNDDLKLLLSRSPF